MMLTRKYHYKHDVESNGILINGPKSSVFLEKTTRQLDALYPLEFKNSVKTPARPSEETNEYIMYVLKKGT